MKQNVTLVTGLWNMGRENLNDNFRRGFDHYLECFQKLLKLDFNMIIFVPEDLQDFIWQNRSPINTKVIVKNNEDFKTWFSFYEQVQKIRNDPAWFQQAEWLANSPQAKLELYNPVIMSKMFMLNDAVVHNSFKSEYYFWIDAGITNTVNTDFLNNMSRLPSFMDDKQDKMLFLTYDYTGNTEVHGFERKALAKFCDTDFVEYVARGGFFGGHRHVINQMNGKYWHYLNDTIHQGLMGTEESIFCILCYRHTDLVHRFKVENALVWSFFAHLKDIPEIEEQAVHRTCNKPFYDLKTAVYILTYNSPKQVEWLLTSFEQTDPKFLTQPTLYLVNNSTDKSTTSAYQILCDKYNIKHIKKDNLGVCGGRQFVAEHFEQSDADYYMFFEDDMFLFPPAKATCQSGFRVFIPDLYENTLAIMHKEHYDYLKLSYSEFYGTNEKQWAWFNIDDAVRRSCFPDHPTKTSDPNDAPHTVQTCVKRRGDIEYYEGEYHYCNWPLWVSREGNYKIFLENPPQFFFEQIWMAQCFYKQRAGQLRAAVMGLSPINHNRFVFYPAEERKEC